MTHGRWHLLVSALVIVGIAAYTDREQADMDE